MRLSMLVLGVFLLSGCGAEYEPEVPKEQASAPSGKVETAVFAGGCFWCTEADFEKVPGVISAVSGYTGGTTDNPTYEQVSAGGTGHYEAVEVRFDPARVSYPVLAQYFFRTVDPTDATGQFCDKGESYRTAILVAGDPQKDAAGAAKKAAGAVLKQAVVTPILPAALFWPAENYHQDYYKLNSVKYRYYRSRCGRDARLKELWG